MKAIYIYNSKQAGFFMINGVVPTNVGRHYKTEKIFYVFDRNRIEKLLKIWNEKA